MSPGAWVIGDVRIDDGASIWYGSVLRGDLNYIKIGKNCSIQDNTTFHVEKKRPVILNDNVIVGHGAIVHSSTVENHVLIGNGAIVSHGVEIGEYSIIGAGALVVEGTKIPPRSIVLGVPAKVVKPVENRHVQMIHRIVNEYQEIKKLHEDALKNNME